jgi:aconitase A
MSVYDAAQLYKKDQTPLLVIAGKGIRQRIQQGLGGKREHFFWE